MNMNYNEKDRLIDCATSLMRNAGNLLDMTGENIIFFGGIGRERRLSWYDIKKDEVRCGCFQGTLAQYEDQIAKYAANYPHHAMEYEGAIQFIKACRAARLKYPPQVSDEKCCEAVDPQPIATPIYVGENTAAGGDCCADAANPGR
jgi:hypothetical protein